MTFMYVCGPRVFLVPRESVRFPEAGVVDSHEPPGRSWEQRSGPLLIYHPSSYGIFKFPQVDRIWNSASL